MSIFEIIAYMVWSTIIIVIVMEFLHNDEDDD